MLLLLFLLLLALCQSLKDQLLLQLLINDFAVDVWRLTFAVVCSFSNEKKKKYQKKDEEKSSFSNKNY